MMDNLVQIVTTVATREEASQMAESVVRQRKAACAQVMGPIDSTYVWDGQLATSVEWRVLLKTNKSTVAELIKLISELHPYDEPQIVGWEIDYSTTGYRKWVADSLS